MSKKLFGLLAVLVLFVGVKSHASAIVCGVDQMDGRAGDADYTVALADMVRATCNNGEYSLLISGLGVGLRFSGGTKLVVSCPFSDEIAGTYGGVKVDASAVVGVDLALFVGTHGICAVGGANGMSIGANVSVASRLVIRKIDAGSTGNN